MLHDAEGGESDASDLSLSMCPSFPTLAALLSPDSRAVTPTSTWTGQRHKVKNTTAPDRAKWGRQDQHSGSGYETRVASWMSLQHLGHHFGGYRYGTSTSINSAGTTHSSITPLQGKDPGAAVWLFEYSLLTWLFVVYPSWETKREGGKKTRCPAAKLGGYCRTMGNPVACKHPT